MIPSNFHEYVEEADAEMSRRDLRHFIRRTWPIVENSAVYKHGWHIDCISDHLHAVVDGEITRLLVNIPPRHMKSTLCSVMFPAWVWLERPETKFLGASYSQHLSVRDCRKSRNIISHPLYTSLIETDEATGEPAWRLSSDQNVKSMYENSLTGQRFATSVGGSLTGEGGDIIIVDDPHNVQEITPAKLEAVHSWWDEAMPTRLNDPKTGVFIVIMQRTNEADLSGHILAKEHNYQHLCLPARHEGKSRIVSGIGWVDPRKEEGEPLWPQHYDDEGLGTVEKSMSAYGRAGQLQQRPAPREGGIFKDKDFQHMTDADFHALEIVRSVRYWDKAGTEDGGAATAGVLVHLMEDGRFVVSDVVRGQWSYAKREARMKAASLVDFEAHGRNRKRYEIHFEQEPGSGGKESAERTKENMLNDNGRAGKLTGAKITIDRVTGAKEVRAEPYAVQVENHNVYVLKRSWTPSFLAEHSGFPKGAFKDQVDAAAGAIVALTGKRRKAKVW